MNTTQTGEPRLAAVASWAVLTASFVLSASTWIALAELAGFTHKLTIPLRETSITLGEAWLMPIAVDGYVVVALVLWMSPVPAKVAKLAKYNTYGAAAVGILAQTAYHLLSTLSTTDEAWRVVLAGIVGALPPTLAGGAVHMRALIRRESKTHTTTNISNPVTPTIATPITTTSIPVPTTASIPTTVAPATPPDRPSTDPAPAQPVTVPDRSPATVPTTVPSPATVAARLTRTTATTRPTPATVPGPAAPTTTTRTSTPPVTGTPLTPSATDSPVDAPDVVQLALPMTDPGLLARAIEVARQYQTEHGTRITPGALAVRLRVPTGQASQLLQAVDDTPAQTDPTTTGRPVKAIR